MYESWIPVEHQGVQVNTRDVYVSPNRAGRATQRAVAGLMLGLFSAWILFAYSRATRNAPSKVT